MQSTIESTTDNSPFAGKKILLGVTGSIAAYKAANIASTLTKVGADVHVVMTKHAGELIGSATFWSITSNPVVENLFERPSSYQITHVSLPETSDIFVIAPASANTIGKLANGIADDMLSTMALSATCPMIIAPAMNCNMYLNPVVVENLDKLKRLGRIVVEPEAGRLACGDFGVGRLAQPDLILQAIADALKPARKDYTGKRVLVSAGPTEEPIDPVRFISNRSSGKMGYAIASAAAGRGAQVILISGPCNLSAPAGVEVVDVTSSGEMFQAVLSKASECDVFISAAAPADFAPAVYSDQKIKKSESLTLQLTKTEDILATLGAFQINTTLVGFAAETLDVLENAQKKLVSKNLDMIVANDVSEGKVFGSDDNQVTILTRKGQSVSLPAMSKAELAQKILDHVFELLEKE